MAATLAVALAVPACSGDGGGSTPPPQAPESASTTRMLDEAGADAPIEPRVTLDELCAETLTIAGVDLTAAGQIPTDDGETLGETGARALLDEMIDPDLTFCGLETSSQARALIDAADEAFTAGDPSEADRILESILDADQQAWIPWSGEGILAAGTATDDQRVRDLTDAAAAAYRHGNEELGDQLAGQARGLAIDAITTRIQETNDPTILLTVAAQAQLLGADDLAQVALLKALSILNDDLETMTDGDPELGTPAYDPCTSSTEEASEYVEATAVVILLGGESDETANNAKDLILTTWERMHDYQAAADECGNLTFTAIEEVPGWDGLIELELRTCDASVWKGIMTIDVTFNAGGGTGHQTGAANASVVLELGQTQATNDIEMDRTITFDVAGRNVVVSNPLTGTITFGVDARNATAKAVVDFPTSTETVSAGGMSISMPVQGMHAEFTGTLSHDNNCD